ncbi:MAG: hypothetical protein A2Y33_01440 [Spirochaetes bacterium GWF1_51_8]|nr:MAG: hypothetical protein A2Y33_01440 [Spirochaetes bacterium GWF1_51_8]
MRSNYESVKTGDKEDRFWTIPNMLTLSRIVMAVPIGILLSLNTPSNYLWVFIILIVAYITDWADGFIARATDSISRYGKILDPIGDKLIASVVSLILFIHGLFPLYLFLTIFIRDFGILAGAFYAMKKKNLLATPNIVGKLSTLVLAVVLPLYPVKYSTIPQLNIEWLNLTINYTVEYGSYLVAGLLIISAIIYGITYIQNVFKKAPGDLK